MEYSSEQDNTVTERQIVHELAHMQILAAGVCART